MSTLTESDLADFAERYAGVEWAVYVQGLDEVFATEIPDLPPDAPGNAPLTRKTAIEFAENVAEDSLSLAALHGCTIPRLVPFVLCHGIVWTPR